MDKFRVGQKVRIMDSIYVMPFERGMIYTIAEPRTLHKVHDPLDRISMQFAYKLSDGEYAEEDILEPVEDILEPVYDGDQSSSWSECAWKPTLITLPCTENSLNKLTRKV